MIDFSYETNLNFYYYILSFIRLSMYFLGFQIQMWSYVSDENFVMSYFMGFNINLEFVFVLELFSET